ncbi:MAG TPA: peptidase [Planctomycetota bacterium]|nr:peptidase [Planctomycetota bacterium]
MGRRDKAKGKRPDPALERFQEGLGIVRAHPLFGRLLAAASVHRPERGFVPDDGWAIVMDDGSIYVHPRRIADPEEWVYVLAHALLHLAFGHFRRAACPVEWGAAACAAVARFLSTLRVGRPPEALRPDVDELPAGSEDELHARFVRERAIPEEARRLGLGGSVGDLWFVAGAGGLFDEHGGPRPGAREDWRKIFAGALAEAVSDVLEKAARPSDAAREETRAGAARRWFFDHFPLLGALAAGFELVEDPKVLAALNIGIAAVSATERRLYVDARRLDDLELRFVMAHELLHVGLRHETRCQGRDFFLWNVACDYVINGWLVEMGVGELPRCGGLLDPALRGLSAEAVYDRIVVDLRRRRKLATLRGEGLADILDGARPACGAGGAPCDLDRFYRERMAQGLAMHQSCGRGLLPAGLVEEIRAIAVPPIPWDVELARWFDRHFAPLEPRRTYARASRRQSATPDIPRPARTDRERFDSGRTFGVVLDTSGSMEPATLAKALGAIASYAEAHEVPAVRVVHCDASPYDQGYLRPEAIGGARVAVKGRGGTVLQPAIDLLERAPDFPSDGPILVITDGLCDRLAIRRSHAFLLPAGRSLPFLPKGEVFRIS